MISIHDLDTVSTTCSSMSVDAAVEYMRKAFPESEVDFAYSVEDDTLKLRIKPEGYRVTITPTGVTYALDMPPEMLLNGEVRRGNEQAQ